MGAIDLKTFSVTELRGEIASKVNAIFVELFELEMASLRPETKLFDDLGLDSLDAIEMAIRFQREFKIRPPNQELMKIRTLADVYKIVEVYAHQTAQKESEIVP